VEKAGALQKNGVPEAGKNPERGNTSGPSSPRPLQGIEKNISPPAQTSVKTNAAPGGAPVAGLPQTLSGMVRTLGLPGDSLSAFILSFARYFSLPLNPGLMAKIRRESLSAVPAEARPGGALSLRDPPRNRDAQSAAAFAAAAAAAKGLELSREGLAAYAAAIDPEYPEKHSGDSGGKPGGGPEQNPGDSAGGGDSGPENQKNGQEGGGRREDFGGGPRAGLDRDSLTRPDTLGEKVLEIEEQNPLLDLLNRVPGKNGERWIVLPFTFTQKGLEYRVSLQVSAAAPCSRVSPGRLVMDISGGPRDKPVLRRRFIYDTSAGGPRLQGRFWPPENKGVLKSFQKELARLFNLQITKINLKNDEENTSYAKNFRDDILPTINEEV
jgi:hypothetical protein